ncbi:MAG: PQQ-dependent sugar dehydrogenase [bacterium]|nr:PQQ-dependent sugar dehydrogenase [bacterium]
MTPTVSRILSLGRAAVIAFPVAVGVALAPAQSLPLGFVVETVAGNQRGPIALDFLPDGRLLFAEQDTGAVKVVVSGSVSTVGTVPGLAVSYSQGLLALAVDPQWPARPFLYCYHTDAAAADLRITRYEITGDLGNAASSNLQFGSSYVVLAGIPDTVPQHEGGELRFGGDGMLYASFGDDRNGCLAQDVTAFHGKLVRLRVDGLPPGSGGPPPRSALVPAGNPFTGPGDVAPLVWATGLRNPFRFDIDPVAGELFVADVGEQAFDEISRIDTAGGNLGWPWREGSAPWLTCAGNEPPSITPIAEHAIPASFFALVSLAVYRADPAAPFRFGPGYDGDYFYVEHFSGDVWRLDGGSGWQNAVPVPGQPTAELWATGLRWITAGRVGPDGALYFVERRSSTRGSVQRIRPAGAAFQAFGTGCSSVPPVLASAPASLPVLGGTFDLRVQQLPPAPGGLTIGMIGFSKTVWAGQALPLPLAGFGMPGCTGLVAPALTTLVVPSGGVANWPLPLPAASAFAGQDFFVQALVLDPSRNAAGLAVSNGGEGVMR